MTDSSETQKRTFYCAVCIEISYPPPPTNTTYKLTPLYLQITTFLCRHYLHTCPYKSQHSRVLSALAGAARNAAGNHRCVDSQDKTAPCSLGCKVWEVVYKKLGMDVCQEVVNKLGALFFLWLSLRSHVCLWRRCPTALGRLFLF